MSGRRGASRSSSRRARARARARQRAAAEARARREQAAAAPPEKETAPCTPSKPSGRQEEKEQREEERPPPVRTPSPRKRKGGGAGTPLGSAPPTPRRSPSALQRIKEEEEEAEEEFRAWERLNPRRAPGSEEAAVTARLRDVNAELQCGVCLSVVDECTTVMECMHRFCAECIETSLRLGRNECPACRHHIPSRRSLRADGSFDAMVGAFYPGDGDANTAEDAFVSTVIDAHGAVQAGDAIRLACERQSSMSSQLPGLKRKRTQPSSSSSSSGSSSSEEGEEGEEEEEDEAEAEEEENPALSPARVRAKRRRAERAPVGPWHGKGGGNGMSSVSGKIEVQLRREAGCGLPQVLLQFVRVGARATVLELLGVVAAELDTHGERQAVGAPPVDPSSLRLAVATSDPSREPVPRWAVLPRSMTLAAARRTFWNRPENMTVFYSPRRG